MFDLTARGRRRLALALVAYGLAGMAVLGASGIVLSTTIDELTTFGGTLGGQREALLDALRATSLTVRDAAAGIGNVGGSLQAARTSAVHASGLARDLSSSLHGLSRAMAVEILGTRPLAELASGFENAARQSDELATDLDDVADGLSQGSADLAVSRRDLAALGDRIDGLVAAVEAVSLTMERDTLPARVALFGLLLWLALPAAASLGIGAALLRQSG